MEQIFTRTTHCHVIEHIWLMSYFSAEFKDNYYYSAAGSTLISITDIVETKVGVFDPGTLTMYCIRRFGYPLHNCDDCKDLMRWRVSTSNHDFSFLIDVKPSRVYFYLLTFDSIWKKATINENPKLDAWWKKVKTAYGKSKGFRLRELNKMPSQGSDFALFAENYAYQIEDMPPNFVNTEPPPVHYQAFVTAVDAATELLRPTSVRDVYFNAQQVGCDNLVEWGEEDTPQEGENNAAESHPSSGYGLLKFANMDSEELKKLFHVGSEISL